MNEVTVDVRSRRGGKTTALLERVAALDDPSTAVVFVHSVAYAKQLRGIYSKRHPGRPLPRFLSHRQRETLRGVHHPRVFVDNAEILLAEMLGCRPEHLTMTGRLA